ncbi:hypothetical protein EYF80_016362 [Liparis tanakae]|uniref:Uncharacterized protein n=1 Tax=Liparis tanakae TaxID=230148 RepID=A0A4Z2I645_9TELE|nr:hypothetical protein EYF80_016362 [Liparis tanakae]
MEQPTGMGCGSGPKRLVGCQVQCDTLLWACSVIGLSGTSLGSIIQLRRQRVAPGLWRGLHIPSTPRGKRVDDHELFFSCTCPSSAPISGIPPPEHVEHFTSLLLRDVLSEWALMVL